MKIVEKWIFQEHYMLLFILLKIVFTIMTLSCKVPTGIFIPIFTIGIVGG
jgi:chloride channel 2